MTETASKTQILLARLAVVMSAQKTTDPDNMAVMQVQIVFCGIPRRAGHVVETQQFERGRRGRTGNAQGTEQPDQP